MREKKNATVPAPAQGAVKGAEVDPELEGLMSEIESDLRDDELKKIWTRYGHVLLGAAIVLVLAVLGVQLYRQHQAELRDQLSARYSAATQALEAGQSDDALAKFKEISGQSQEGYGALARLGEAAALIKKGDVAGAVAAYKALAADQKADPVFRDLATILRVMNSLDRDDPKTLEDALTPLMTPSNPFNASATELSALLAAKRGDTARAAQLAQQIVSNPDAPQSMRQRAQDLASLYKPAEPETPAAPTAATPSAATATPTPPPPADKTPESKP